MLGYTKFKDKVTTVDFIDFWSNNTKNKSNQEVYGDSHYRTTEQDKRKERAINSLAYSLKPFPLLITAHSHRQQLWFREWSSCGVPCASYNNYSWIIFLCLSSSSSHERNKIRINKNSKAKFCPKIWGQLHESLLQVS